MGRIAAVASWLSASLAIACVETESTAARSGLADESQARGLCLDTARGGSDYFMPDSMGPGCALFDADGDGDLDAFLVQAVRAKDGALESEAGRDRLFLQSADGVFVDASAGSGVDDPRYGMGAAVADVDQDGDLDLFVTNYGSSRLYSNRGDGRFDDATESSGIREDAWAATAGFFDYDGDGRPDLFVVRYLDFDPKVRGIGASGQPDYPSPLQFRGLADGLWRNEGGGRFRDVSRECGIAGTPGRGLGLCFDDLDDDGRPDVFVANDTEPNFAWVQTAPGKFENRAFALGLAVNRVGRPQANMGVAHGDADGDGALDLFVTHLVAETNVLYRRTGKGKFMDATDACGLSEPSLDLTGFGAHFADVENDGDLDLAVVNGRILRRGPRAKAKLPEHWVPYAEENQLFLNDGTGRFALASPAEGGDWSRAVAVGRAMAFGDVDRDGGLDVLVNNGDGSARIYGNRFQERGRWLAVRALDESGTWAVLGARVEVRAGTKAWVRRVGTCQGYLSAGDPLVHFGLGASDSLDQVFVDWPGGEGELFPGGAPDRVLVVRRGEGERRPQR